MPWAPPLTLEMVVLHTVVSTLFPANSSLPISRGVEEIQGVTPEEFAAVVLKFQTKNTVPEQMVFTGRSAYILLTMGWKSGFRRSRFLLLSAKPYFTAPHRPR
ncbi:unnamed protein product [Pieris brassicae]|uniref:Uncharacterized protein n=1 Tax=Pieris brassicae TaxID=7116 RepID=A0A9P0TMI4_PIEBR|nr:unnamed protein product [Pieris brassicae]